MHAGPSCWLLQPLSSSNCAPLPSLIVWLLSLPLFSSEQLGRSCRHTDSSAIASCAKQIGQTCESFIDWQGPARFGELTLVPQLQIAYVENRKCSSTTIRQLLKTHFNAGWDFCGNRTPANDTCRLVGRCVPGCLDSDTVAQYFFFTFVRSNVTARFYSGAVTAEYMRKRYHSDHKSSHRLSYGVLMKELHQRIQTHRYSLPNASGAIKMSECFSNEHLASQVGSLSLRTPRSNGSVVPLDFIGPMEQLADSFVCMLHKARARHASLGRYHIAKSIDSVLASSWLATSLAPSKGLWSRSTSMDPLVQNLTQLLTAELTGHGSLDELIRTAYKQDLCLLSKLRASGTREDNVLHPPHSPPAE
mmetsp:Transcript_60112/g.137846  ORF Transcript_60112/g.137846 Transcript_60112/m.137846 type:complete len:361 (+) Transcript_60112:59-1141(+)|eukprot:CAMPEP_0119403882 /NCGR_PEP_ID=MMETSP1334-20130426/143611_1 /TAXON_ID=127549 /ORGANISM="Calcidiscus leptoporus, Strain RCC1130" /LENGTH=360 /DNA_ID=CAMNT_0007427833 /DNA_START=764 /DNA_END=1846 /DNA_ORIENTATION=+